MDTNLKKLNRLMREIGVNLSKALRKTEPWIHFVVVLWAWLDLARIMLVPGHA